MASNTEHQLLQYIADSLVAEDSNKFNQYLQYFEDIKSTLLRSSQFQISRVTLTGSMKKRTAVHHKFDCDILVYLKIGGSFNDKITFKQHFLNQAEGILRQTFPFMQKVKTTPNSFQFSIGDFDFDILPAVDLVDDWSDPNASHQQWSEVIQLCNSQPKPHITSYKLKASLSEYCDDFIKNQSDFIRRLIVLCKHWCRVYLSTSVNFPGRSSTMELIAMSVGLQMERMRRFDLFEALKAFLRQCSNIDNCAIEFDQTAYLKSFSAISIRRQRPYLLDPMNPYNNRLCGIKPHSREDIQRIANQSINYFHRLEQNCFLGVSSDYTKDFAIFFELNLYLNKEVARYDNYLQFLKQEDEETRLRSTFGRLSLNSSNNRSSVSGSSKRTRPPPSLKSSSTKETKPNVDFDELFGSNTTNRSSVSGSSQRRFDLDSLRKRMTTKSHENERNNAPIPFVQRPQTAQVLTSRYDRYSSMINNLNILTRKLKLYYSESDEYLSSELNDDIDNLILYLDKYANELRSLVPGRLIIYLPDNLTEHMLNVNKHSKKLLLLSELLNDAKDLCLRSLKLLDGNVTWPLKDDNLILFNKSFKLFLLTDSIRLKFATRMKNISMKIQTSILPVMNSITTDPIIKYCPIISQVKEMSTIFMELFVTFQEDIPIAETNLNYQVVSSSEGIQETSVSCIINLLIEAQSPMNVINHSIEMLSNSFNKFI